MPGEARRGLSRQVVEEISSLKNEPKWMRDYRLKSFAYFTEKEIPDWGPDLSKVDFNDICYYLKPLDKEKRDWNEVPEKIKKTFEVLGIPQAERDYLAGVKAQYDSEVAYSSLQKEAEEEGVIFLSMDQALKKYPSLVQEHFGKLIPFSDNKFSALNSAVWSGGSFVYIPKGVKVKRPLQAYFRLNARNMGQFERTLIIADENSFAHYIEGCTAPVYSADSLHAAVVEVYVKKNARLRYTTIQNWSGDVYNLVTKRAGVEENGVMEWVDGNLGSRVTMKYPSCYLIGNGARGEMLSLSYAGENQNQDAGAKMVHLAPNTSSIIVSKSVSQKGGVSSYRGLVEVSPIANNSKSHVECDALILDSKSFSNTYPVMRNNNNTSYIEHEASVSKVSDERIFYLMSRGLSKSEAMGLVVSGFIEPIIKDLPMEYAVELNNLINMEMEGSVG